LEAFYRLVVIFFLITFQLDVFWRDLSIDKSTDFTVSS
jgi:hypothetical protein